ncbi:MAG: hypothetical protein J6R77_08545, partial [Clostridia bacterium]|nr:hypothetical protein [Clostridia bacterium]
DANFGRGKIYDLTEAENIGEITYNLALFPHDGCWRGVYKDALAFLTAPALVLDRMPEVAVMTDYQKPALALPAIGSAVEITGEHVMITAIKKAYNNNSLIVRVLNYSDKEEAFTATLTFPGKTVARVFATDLDEGRLQEINTANNVFTYTLRKAQVATFEIEMA